MLEDVHVDAECDIDAALPKLQKLEITNIQFDPDVAPD